MGLSVVFEELSDRCYNGQKSSVWLQLAITLIINKLECRCQKSLAATHFLGLFFLSATILGSQFFVRKDNLIIFFSTFDQKMTTT